MMRIGFFILPNKKLNNEIVNWKKKVKKSIKQSFYLNDPPHLTLYHSKFENIDEMINSLKVKISKEEKILINVYKNDIFFNDPITNCDTLHFCVKRNFKLINLQKRLVNIIKKYSIIDKNFKFNDSSMNLNYKKFGFPFIGKNWKPHFTIASIRYEKISNSFIKNNFRDSFKVDKIHLYEIQNNSHKYICEIKI